MARKRQRLEILDIEEALPAVYMRLSALKTLVEKARRYKSRAKMREVMGEIAYEGERMRDFVECVRDDV